MLLSSQGLTPQKGLWWRCPRTTPDWRKGEDLPSSLLPGYSRVGLIKVSGGPALQMASLFTPLPHGERARELSSLSPRTAVGGWGAEAYTCHSHPSAPACPGSLASRDLKEWEVKTSVKILSHRVAHGCTVLGSLPPGTHQWGDFGCSDNPPLQFLNRVWAHLPTEPEADSQHNQLI